MNKLLHYSSLSQENLSSYQRENNNLLFKELVALAAEDPLEYTCTMNEAFQELEDEFQKRRAQLHSIIGSVVFELVKQRYNK